MEDTQTLNNARKPVEDSLERQLALRERIAEAGWKYDGHVTNGSLDEIMKVINGNDSVQSIVDRLLLIGDQCEAGGHKSRARMFRMLAKSFKVRFL